MTETNQWHNTGGNGKAREVWVRTVGDWTAEIKVMPYRCLVTMYINGKVDADHEGIPFQSSNASHDDLAVSKRWADSFIARQEAK